MIPNTSLGNGMVGRRRKPGARYPAGKLKRPLPDIAPILVKRIRDNVLKLAGDVRYATQIGNLNLQGILTNTQTAAAFRVNEVYQRWHHVKHLRGSPKSSNYERSFGSADVAEERMGADEIEQLEARVRAATEAWESLDGFFQQLSRELRKAILDLCVFDQMVSPVHYDDIAVVLDHLAVRWRDHFGRQDVKLVQQRLGGTTPVVAEIRPAPRPDDSTLTAVRLIALRLRPNLTDEDLIKIKLTFLALRDRSRFEAIKKYKP